MNSAKNVVQFIVACFLCLFLLSAVIHIQNSNTQYLKNISILSDVLPEKTRKSHDNKPNNSVVTDTVYSIDNLIKTASKKINTFSLQDRITNYNIDTSSIVLNSFISKLASQTSFTNKRKIRIAYLGDSMIEGDLISQTLRQLLQKKFGGKGVGFVPITSLVSYFRKTIKHSFSNNWVESNFKKRITNAPLFLSGKVYNSKGYNWVDYDDKTVDSRLSSPLYKYLITGYKPSSAQILVNKSYAAIPSIKPINKLLLDSSAMTQIKIETSDAQLPIYGMSFETNDGIIIDNLSFRGLAGFEYNTIDTLFLQSIQQAFEYDLVILQFGVNVLNMPTNNQFKWYYNAMTSTVTKLKKCFPKTEFLLIGAADKAFKYKTGYATAVGMDSLIATQQKIAFDTEIAFYNAYANMGGYNSIIKWANQTPSMAAKDYTHLNFKGAEFLGTSVYKAIMYEFNKLGSTTKR